MKKKNSLFRFYQNYLKQYKWKILISLILIGLGGFALAYGPRRIGDLTTYIYESILAKVYGTGDIEYRIIRNSCLIIFFIYLMAGMLIMLGEKILTIVVQNGIEKLKNNVAVKMNKISMSWMENKEKNTKIQNIYNELDTIDQYFNIIINTSLIVISVMIGSIYFMVTTNIQLSILMLIIFPALTFMIKLVSHRQKKKERVNAYRRDKLEESIQEIVNGHTIIDFLNCKDKILCEFERRNKRAKKSNQSSQKTVMHVEAFSTLIGNLELATILGVGFYLCMLEKITLGNIQTFLLYNKLIERPIFIISKISNIIYLLKNTFTNIFEFMDIEEEKTEGKEKFSDGDIVFQNVNFEYYENVPILKDFNLHVKQGEKIAIVGKTGAGKSTIMKLLLRLYTNYNGKIMINNTNINDFDLESLRSEIGIVPQNSWIINGTIKENILYGNALSNDENVVRIAKKIGIDDDIERLPEKYDTKVDADTTVLTPSQKQLICIARMMLKNPKIVLLDEATNMIDYQMEEIVKDTLKEFLKNKTCFTIAHRLSTVTDSDKIIVVENGEIVEQGTHKQLIDNKKRYYQMYMQLN